MTGERGRVYSGGMISAPQTLSFDLFSLLCGIGIGALALAVILIPLLVRARHNASAMKDTFSLLANDALRSSQDQFLQLAQEKLRQAQMEGSHDLDKRQKAISDLVDPIQKTMKDMEGKIEGLGRVGAGLEGQLKTFADDQRYLREQTQSLVKVLGNPAARGQWGEMQLQRAFEVIGFQEGIHYHSQKSVRSGEGAQLKPDFIISMPNGVQIVIDVKTPLDPYWDMLDQNSQQPDAQVLGQFRQRIREHLKALSQKDYWRQFDSPEFVVMFLPSEGLYSLAISQDQALMEEAARANIILASPTTVMGLLRVVMYGWQQQRIAEEAQNISTLASDLYRRIAIFGDHMAKVGRNLGSAVDSYNKSVGSLEGMILPVMRKFKDLQVSTGGKDIPAVAALEQPARAISSPELLANENSTESPELVRLKSSSS